MVSTFKDTSDPIQEVFQINTDETIEIDYSLIDTEPLDIFSRQELYTEDIQDRVYGTNEEFNTLYYDIEHDIDNEASEAQVPNQSSISKSVISTFVCTQQKHNHYVLLKLMVRSRECGSKLYSDLNPKSIPSLL